MERSYYVWTANGWFSKGGGFTTQIASARIMSREEAFRLCRRHIDPATGATSAVPVSEADYMELIS